MSAELDRMAERLRALSERLTDPSVSDEEAEQLAREAADLAAKASAAVTEALRRASADE